MPLYYLPYTLWEQIPFGDRDAWLDWLAPHFMVHQALAAKTGTAIYLLDTMRKDPFPHGNMHRDVAAALGLPPTWDFTSYDLSDKSAFSDFMLAHASSHQQLAAAAGL